MHLLFSLILVVYIGDQITFMAVYIEPAVWIQFYICYTTGFFFGGGVGGWVVGPDVESKNNPKIMISFGYEVLQQTQKIKSQSLTLDLFLFF